MDRGGTWIRLKGFDAHGRPLKYVRQPTVSLKKLPIYIKNVFKRWKQSPKNLVVASRGVWAKSKRNALTQTLRPLAQRVRVISDVEAAWHAAGKGIVLIGGTGSIALMRTANGWKRAGGLGPAKGDEGSGLWIAKRWLALHNPLPLKKGGREGFAVRQIPLSPPFSKGEANLTGLVADVIKRAKRGDLLAQSVIHEAYGHLFHLLTQLTLKSTDSVYLHGGLFEIPFFRRGFMRFARRSGWRGSWLTPHCDAATAAAKTIMQTYGPH